MKRLLIIAIAGLFFNGMDHARAQPATAEKSLVELVKEFNSSYPVELKKVKAAVREGKGLDAQEFSDSYKKLLFNIYLGYNSKIAQAKSSEAVAKKDEDVVKFFKSALEKMEYRETEVDQASEELKAHYVYLEASKYRLRKKAFVDFVSWQTQATLSGPFENTALLANNLGYQAGFGFNFENSYWSFGTELAGLIGYGGVSSVAGLIDYQQSSVPAFGGRFSLSGARVVSSSGSLLGIRAAAQYFKQTLSTPSTAGYSIQQDKALSFTTTIFTQWRYDRYYFETEFGRYIARPSTIWSMGVGMLF